MTKEEIAELTLDYDKYVGTDNNTHPCIYCHEQTRNFLWGMVQNALILVTIKYLFPTKLFSTVCNKECLDNYIYEHQLEILERILNEAP